jgi:hypothetical protein
MSSKSSTRPPTRTPIIGAGSDVERAAQATAAAAATCAALVAVQTEHTARNLKIWLDRRVVAVPMNFRPPGGGGVSRRMKVMLLAAPPPTSGGVIYQPRPTIDVCRTLPGLEALASRLEEYRTPMTSFEGGWPDASKRRAARASTRPYSVGSVTDVIQKTYNSLCGEQGSPPQKDNNKDVFLYQKRDHDGRVIVVGDLHGSFHSFVRLLVNMKKEGFLSDDLSLLKDVLLVFTGDFVDRSFYSLETLLIACALRLQNEKSVVMVNGNHEDPPLWGVYGFKEELGNDLGTNSHPTFKLIKSLVYRLPLALFARRTKTGGWTQFSHGFAEKEKKTRDHIKEWLEDDTAKAFFNDGPDYRSSGNGYNWSDVHMREGYEHGGSRPKYDTKAAQEYLDFMNVRCVIRGHQDTMNFALMVRTNPDETIWCPDTDNLSQPAPLCTVGITGSARRYKDLAAPLVPFPILYELYDTEEARSGLSPHQLRDRLARYNEGRGDEVAIASRANSLINQASSPDQMEVIALWAEAYKTLRIHEHERHDIAVEFLLDGESGFNSTFMPIYTISSAIAVRPAITHDSYGVISSL